MLAWSRRSTTLSLSLLAVSAACGTVTVPFEPTDGSGGNGPSQSGGGTTTGGSNSGATGGGDTGGATLGGSGGTSDDGANPGFGAAGGMGGFVGDLLVNAGSPIEGVAATDTHVYWIEYGTFDSLDNYQFDGAFLSMELESGDVEILSEDLEGPIALEITTEEAFIQLDRSTDIDSDGARALGRIPLGGGPLELVEHDGTYSYDFRMTAFEDRAYFLVSIGNEWSLSEHAPGAPARPLVPNDHAKGWNAVDEAYFYYMDFEAEATFRQALSAEGEPEQISSSSYLALAVEGDRLLTTRGTNPTYLAAMPKTGGPWSNVVNLGSPQTCGKLLVSGESFIAGCFTASSSPYLIVGRWDGTEPLASHSLSDEQAWGCNQSDVFIGRGDELFRIPID